MNTAVWGQVMLLAIPLIAPLLTTLFKSVLPKVPGMFLPIVCTLIGVGLDALNTWLTGMVTPPWFGLALGAAGVAVRESLDQAQKFMAIPSPPKDVKVVIVDIVEPAAK